jgi:hypothetical protein
MMACYHIATVQLGHEALVQAVHDFCGYRITTQLDGAASTTNARMKIVMVGAAQDGLSARSSSIRTVLSTGHTSVAPWLEGGLGR